MNLIIVKFEMLEMMELQKISNSKKIIIFCKIVKYKGFVNREI